MTSTIVPIGKYKGQPIEVLQGDPGYAEWLLAQPWFRERYASVFQVIVNNFGEPAETPEHNRLQARFLDPWFCHALLRLVRAGVAEGDDRLDALLSQRLTEAQEAEQKAATEFCSVGTERQMALKKVPRFPREPSR